MGDDLRSSGISDAIPKPGLETLPCMPKQFSLLAGYKFNGQNYKQWAITVHIYLQGKGKDNYIAGEAKQPAKSDPNHAKWKLRAV